MLPFVIGRMYLFTYRIISSTDFLLSSLTLAYSVR